MGHARIGFLVERRYLRQDMPGAVIRALKRRGIASDVLVPRGCRFDPEEGVLLTENGCEFALDRYDLIVSRNRSPLGLAILAYADAAGIPALNTHASTRRVRNKAKMGIVLDRAGVPCAPTVLADDVSVLSALPQSWFPLILKATYGDNSQGLRLIRRREELDDAHWSGELVLAQRYLANDGFDLKLYVCGRRVFAVRKPSPFNGDPAATPHVLEPDARLVDLALRCGATFGLELYGVDALETPEGVAVIEVNEYPNFTGVPGAAEHIADHILAKLEHARSSVPEDAHEDRVLSRAVGA